MDLDPGDETFSRHPRLFRLLERDSRAALVVFTFLNRNIKLKLDVLAVESRHLALKDVGRVRFLAYGSDMRLFSIAKSREDLDI